MLLKDELTTPQQENTDMSYLETTTTFFSTSLYETTSVVSIDSDKIESKGILLRYVSKCKNCKLHVDISLLRNLRKEIFPQSLPGAKTCSSYQGLMKQYSSLKTLFKCFIILLFMSLSTVIIIQHNSNMDTCICPVCVANNIIFFVLLTHILQH